MLSHGGRGNFTGLFSVLPYMIRGIIPFVLTAPEIPTTTRADPKDRNKFPWSQAQYDHYSSSIYTSGSYSSILAPSQTHSRRTMYSHHAYITSYCRRSGPHLAHTVKTLLGAIIRLVRTKLRGWTSQRGTRIFTPSLDSRPRPPTVTTQHACC